MGIAAISSMPVHAETNYPVIEKAPPPIEREAPLMPNPIEEQMEALAEAEAERKRRAEEKKRDENRKA